MTSRNSRRIALTALAGAAAIVIAATASQAAWSPRASAGGRDIQLTSDGCGYAAYRAPNGMCLPALERRTCPPGFHPMNYMNGNGYRCVEDGA
jgi:hypothetical protein